eukprot:scaffold2858_cov659-Pavlova_lutheri.AAC.77
METSPGTLAARAHVDQLRSFPKSEPAKLALRGLGRLGVRNMADDATRKAPILAWASSSIVLPHTLLMDTMMGSMIPPALAATEGISGASSASLKTRL